MSNTATEPAQLSPETQKQLSALTTQLTTVSDDLKKEIKQVISALVVENITLKRENAQLKVDKSSKS
jgi:regulator of replication initiation timing